MSSIRYPILTLALLILLAGCTDTDMPPSYEAQTIIEHSGSVATLDIGDMSMLDKLSHIEREGISVTMISDDGLHASGSTEERYLLGDIRDWERALSTPCDNNTSHTDMKVFTPTFEGDTPVPKEYYCTTLVPEESSSLVERFVRRFQPGIMEVSIPTDEYNPTRVQSNSDYNPSYPRTPLEVFVTTHSLRHINAVVRVIAIRQYGEGILILSAGAQEPGLPGYSITYIYQDGDNLYLRRPRIIDMDRMDTIYGTGFTLELWTLAYEAIAESATQSGIVSLLRGDFIRRPSIINIRIQERLIEEFYNIR